MNATRRRFHKRSSIVLDPQSSRPLGLRVAPIPKRGVTTGGKGIQIKTGANSRCETFTMTNGTVTVANTNVTVNTRLFLGSLGGNSATIGGALNYTINPTVGYTVNSFLGTDTNRVNVLLIEQIP